MADPNNVVLSGQGFAFKRKQKMQYEYKKLLRKERRTSETKTQFQDKYPDHLKHLYRAEAMKLKNEEEMNRLKRRKGHEAVSEEDFAEEDTSKASRAPVHPEPPSRHMDDRLPTAAHSAPVEPSRYVRLTLFGLSVCLVINVLLIAHQDDDDDDFKTFKYTVRVTIRAKFLRISLFLQVHRIKRK